MAHSGLVESILSCNIAAWYCNLNIKSKNELSITVNIAGKVIGKSQRQLCYADSSHPLHCTEFELLPSVSPFSVPRASWEFRRGL